MNGCGKGSGKGAEKGVKGGGKKGGKGKSSRGTSGRGKRDVTEPFVLDLMTGKSVRLSDVSPRWDEIIRQEPHPVTGIDEAFLALIHQAEMVPYSEMWKTTCNRIRTLADPYMRGRVVSHAIGTRPILAKETRPVLSPELPSKANPDHSSLIINPSHRRVQATS